MRLIGVVVGVAVCAVIRPVDHGLDYQRFLFYDVDIALTLLLLVHERSITVAILASYLHVNRQSPFDEWDLRGEYCFVDGKLEALAGHEEVRRAIVVGRATKVSRQVCKLGQNLQDDRMLSLKTSDLRLDGVHVGLQSMLACKGRDDVAKERGDLVSQKSWLVTVDDVGVEVGREVQP